MKVICFLAVVVSALAGMAAVPAGAREKPPVTGPHIPGYQHIFVIMMENHSYEEIIGNRLLPRINALARTYGLETNDYGVTHPSEPNYVASIGGDYFGIQDDGAYTAHTINAPSLASQLEQAGLSWKTYQQALPHAGYTGTAWPASGSTLYASKHNPFLNFASVRKSRAELRKIVPDTQLAVDLRSGRVPAFGYIVPDQCHDMHGTAGCSSSAALFSAGDAYVGRTVSLIMGSRAWTRGNNAIVVAWDEDDYSTANLGCCGANPGGGHVAVIVVTSHGPRGVRDSAAANHYSLLRTVQDAFRLGCLRHTCDTGTVRPLAPLFVPAG